MIEPPPLTLPIQEPPLALEYAPEQSVDDHRAHRMLRWCVGWCTLACGLFSLIAILVQLAIAYRWLNPNLGIATIAPPTAPELTVIAARSCGDLLLLLGGALLVAKLGSGIWMIRIGAILKVAMTLASPFISILYIRAYASYYGSADRMTMLITQVIASAAPFILIGLLTLPPLARRMLR